MPINPINELKRRLVDDTTPLPKRLCLAKNVIISHHFPTTAKERLVAEWLQTLTDENKLSGEELRNVIGWLSGDLTRELKVKLVQVVSKYLQRNPIQKDDVQSILSFLDNVQISSQLSIQVDDYLYITVTLLQYLRSEENSNFELSDKILNNIIKYYKDSKKKYEFIIKFLNGNNIETIFDYLNTRIRNTVIVLCGNILFPSNKKSFFITLLKTYIRTDNIDSLIAEKGDNIQSVLKIMNLLFAFPKGRTNNDPKYLKDFIDMFVSCFKKESQLIFAFYIMVCHSLQMDQHYLIPTTVMTPIHFDENTEKVKRYLFLNMLEILVNNEINIDIRLTDTLGEKISKVETKKTFLLFLQATMMGQLKLEGKPDKTTIQIIHTALQLDPTLVENKIKEILPPIMSAKKNNNVMESYIKMVNFLLDIFFKLSRGIPFLNKILPLIKLDLEASNTEQFELRTKVKELAGDSKDYEKTNNKLITWKDIFPVECVEMYGKLTADLMFRQNKELLFLLQKDFQDYCLEPLEDEVLNPSTLVLTDLLAAILSTFLHYNKMADHTVPLNIAEEFWASFEDFEGVLKRFGDCVVKHSYEPCLLLSFLKLSYNFSQLKLLNITYSNTKVNLPEVSNTEVFDFNLLLPFFDGEQWRNICSSVNDAEAVEILDKLVLTKIKATEILSETIDVEYIVSAKIHLIKQIATKPQSLNIAKNYLNNVLFYNLDKNLLKQLSKCLVKLYLSNPDESLFKNDTIIYNRDVLNALVLETCRNITKCLVNTDELTKSLSKLDFDLAEFAKERDMKDYFENISKNDDDSTITNCVEILKQLQIYYLEEKYQLVAIFVLLSLKKCCQKKIRRNIDNILHNIFELSSQAPDLYKIFPIQYIFSFEDKTLLNLLTLKNKTSNHSLIIKSILESAVKRVRSDSSLVINIVELLLQNHDLNGNKAANIEYFSDTAFQISCIILPLIAKQKKVLTSSAYRSVLADLQEKLHKSMLEAFKNINFKDSSLLNESTGNVDESMVVSESEMAILNAMAAYSLTLSKYCETTDGEEIKKLDCLWSGLEYFVQNAIHSIQKPETKPQHLETSIQLLNITLRHLKKLESHYIFETKDKVLLQIWQSLKSRLFMVQESGNKCCLEDIGVTVKFLCEHSDVDCFVNNFVGDLTNLTVLEKPQIKKKEDIHKIPTSLKVSQYLWSNCLKANITGPKCVSMAKSIYQTCKSAKTFIWQHYENYQYGVVIRRKKKKMAAELKDQEEVSVVKIDDYTCGLVKVYLDILMEGILAAKKITLDYKFLDTIFELQHQLHVILGFNTNIVMCEVSWQAFFRLCQGSIGILNSLLVAREELLEDRWPCYMQCYRALVRCLCEKSIDAPPDRTIEGRIAETAHNIEKLTQSISKRKVHISRIASYTVADICSTIERTAPSRILRQHIENSVSLLIQVSDTTYSVAFLRRALAGTPGHMTLTNLYTMYKRYHKYTGNA
ncbi:uncharacterized protein LOC128681155 [Plodia interpunctella]|uniref:uncharacterized protein LOC128681155 n=1 Tax=Plodia interpunctella TaxID=58824 RepID=UPI002367D3A9|nr:uncharacterized protein LOC128681155 [Plodia interpunctella]